NLYRSLKRKDLSVVRSVVNSGAPRKTDRGELPKVKGAGAAKAVVSNHWVAVRSLEGNSGFRNKFGRSDPAGNAFVVFDAVITVNGGPDMNVSSTPIFQPPKTEFNSRLRPTPRDS